MQECNSISHDNINKRDERFHVLKYVDIFFWTVCRCTVSIGINDPANNKFRSEYPVYDNI
jgi:hypothetical protein